MALVVRRGFFVMERVRIAVLYGICQKDASRNLFPLTSVKGGYVCPAILLLLFQTNEYTTPVEILMSNGDG